MSIVDSPTRAPRIGESAPRPDGVPKVQGQFAFSSDLWADDMLWGHTLRSPHPHARINSIDITAAVAMTGVYAVLTHDDVPGSKVYGLEHPDQPVLADGIVRYQGEPVAVVAADHPETARRAVEAIAVEYQVLDPLTDADEAIDAEPIHPDGNVFRHLTLNHGDPDTEGDVQVEGTYEVGMQDQAFMGVESGMAVPRDGGGVDLYISTQWLHADQRQIADALGLEPDMVQLTLSGVGGAFGAREDLSMQVHLCLLALHTGRPVKMVYSREESFFGHVHRHPARMWFRHHANRDGTLAKVEARLVLDGGAYASTSSAVLANATCFAAGPYRVPNAAIDGWAVRTNNPPCGAMRGFGAVQTCFAHEAQMDKLAGALGIDPIDLRLRNVLEPGDELMTGQRITGAAPVAELLSRLAQHPLPRDGVGDEPMARPGGAGRTADQSHVRRGVGYAVSVKNLMFSEGFDDYATAGCRLENGVATVRSACAEVGQGFVTLAQQIAREVLTIDEVIVAPADTAIGSAGSTSASRQTWMSGGAVMLACEAVRDIVLGRAAAEHGLAADAVELRDGRVVSADGMVDVALADFAPIDEQAVHRHAPTVPLDENGQGDAHVSFAFAAHRAVVDVDPDLGLLRVVEVATTQDVGKVLNPVQAVGQIEGGIAQGVGLAVMEEIVLDGGRIRNASFTDYLIPTALDMPRVEIAALIEEPEPGAPFGAKGIGEPPTISSTPAVVAAVRAATGLELARVPIRPQDIALADRPPAPSADVPAGVVSVTPTSSMVPELTKLRINVDRLLFRIDDLAAIGNTGDGGNCRLALTDEDQAARDLVVTWMQDLDLEVVIDGIGNIVGTRPGRENLAPVMCGSHIDTVRTGGRLDGNLGVLAGLEIIETMIDAGVTPRRPVSVGVFTNEEGSRFPPDMLGSLVYVGGLALEEALATVGVDGAVLGDELARIGYQGPAPVPGRVPHAFVELHIEQGPVLESEGVTLAAVTGVQGISWREVTITGQSNHAGTTPMSMRADAGYAAASIAAYVRSLATAMGGNQVGTVGRFELFPNLVNVVPGRALLTVDLRNTDEDDLARAEHRLDVFLNELGGEGIEIDQRPLARFAPVRFDPRITSLIADTAARLGHTVMRLPSGAGHDAQMLARVCPSAMVFTPSVGGISHNPAEATNPADLAAGADTLLQVLLELAEEDE